MFKYLKDLDRKKVWRNFLWSLAGLTFLISFAFTSHRENEELCTGVNIVIHDTAGQNFIESSDVRELIESKYGSPENKPLSSINIALLEKTINNNPFVSDAEVFSTIDGKLNIDVNQRTPVLRIINYKSQSFYIDNEGNFMPLSDKYTARVPVANGFLFDTESEKKVVVYNEQQRNDTSFHPSMIDEVYHVCRFVYNDEFWKSEIEQLFVDANGDIELVPRLGNHTIILGDDHDMAEKFKKLFVFYHDGLNKIGWNKYSVINLKYKDQVVCSKN